METRRVKVIFNPISGWGRAGVMARGLKRNLEQRGYRVEFFETHQRGDARRFAADVEGYDRLICVGGDGTLSEVINGLPSSGAPPLAAVPSGTGNAFAKELRLPWGTGRLAEVIDRGRIERWDVGVNHVDGKKFMMFAGAGFQAEVIRHFQRARRGPVFAGEYFRWGFHVALQYPLPSITVEVDGRIVDRDAPWVEIFNISHYGGPLRIASHARPDDGRFDIMIFKGRQVRDIIRLLVAGFATFVLRSPYRLREMRFIRGRRVRLFSEGEVSLHMDGDDQGRLPADLEILPRQVGILAP